MAQSREQSAAVVHGTPENAQTPPRQMHSSSVVQGSRQTPLFVSQVTPSGAQSASEVQGAVNHWFTLHAQPPYTSQSAAVTHSQNC